MKSLSKNPLFGYALAIFATAVAAAVQMALRPYLGSQFPYITFFPAVFITAIFARLGPALLSVALSALAATYWFVPPAHSVIPQDNAAWLGLSLFIVFGVGIGALGERMHRQTAKTAHERERFFVTLSSIGDGVIVTDSGARVTFMNPLAEQLTGWPLDDARGRPLETIFQIVNEVTRKSAENPVTRALRERRVVGLANHTVLIARDASEKAINDSAAPIVDPSGHTVGVVLVFRDVSDQRAGELAASRLAALVDSSEDAILAQTFDGVVSEWNAGAERLFGFSAEEIVGRPIFSTIVPPDRKDELLKVLQRVKRGERVNHFETVRRCKDGRVIPVSVRISPIQDTAGEVIGASAIDRDVSHQTLAEKRRGARLAVTQILAQEQDVGAAIAQSLEAVCSSLEWDVGCFWRFDPHLRVMRCLEYWQVPSYKADAFRDATLSLELAEGRSLPGRVLASGHPMWIADVAADPKFVRAREAATVGLHGALACPVAVGDRFLGVVEWFSRQVQRPDDDLLEMMATIGAQIGQFIERKNSEDAVRQSERLYRAIGESIDYGVWVCDPEGRNIYTSESFLKLVGLTQQECSEFGWSRVLHPDDVEEAVTAWKRCVKSKTSWYREHRCLGVDGKHHPILARGVPVVDAEGRVLCWAGINLDISSLKKVEDELRNAHRRKDEFLAMLAHELRNPLAPIRTGLDILSMDDGRPSETVRLMQEQVEHLVRLVDDLLDVSRIMRDRVELRREEVELATLVDRSVRAVRPLVEEHSQQLTLRLPEAPVWLKVDPVRVVQVLENLLNNASKYTDSGGRIDLVAERAGGNAVISVRDTGVGIEPELLPHIFELFTQSTRSLDRAQGGLGIGLTLVRRLVEMHGGSVSVDSPGLGHGSTFTVRLPVAEASTKAARQADAPSADAGPRRILLVDDNVGAARMLAMLLNKLDEHDIEKVHDGPTALAILPSFRPEVVLLDIGLPGMDGYQVAREIREQRELDDVLLVALTGYGQQEDRRRSQEAGFDEHFVKPLSSDQIREILLHPKLAGSAVS